MTRALVTQMLNALEHHQSQTRPIHKTEFAITAAREYLATKAGGERAELIAKLRTGWTVTEESEFERLDDLCRKAADMLEADAQQAKLVPMTEKQIDKIHANTARLAQRNTTFFIAFARALESHHKINAPK